MSQNSGVQDTRCILHADQNICRIWQVIRRCICSVQVFLVKLCLKKDLNEWQLNQSLMN